MQQDLGQTYEFDATKDANKTCKLLVVTDPFISNVYKWSLTRKEIVTINNGVETVIKTDFDVIDVTQGETPKSLFGLRFGNYWYKIVDSTRKG